MCIIISKFVKTQLYLNTVSLFIDGFMVTYSNTSVSLLLYYCIYMYRKVVLDCR